MKFTGLIPRSFFHISFPQPLTRLREIVINSHRGDRFVYDVVKLIVDNYVNRYRVEDIELKDIIAKYGILNGLIQVELGYSDEELIYVVRDAAINVDILNRVVGRIINEGENGSSIDIATTFEKPLDVDISIEDYVYLKIISGLGPITPLMLDPHIEDVFVCKTYRRPYVVHNEFSSSGWIKTNIVLEPELVDMLTLAISRKIGKHISLLNPLVEGSYGSKLRISLVFGKTISPHGSSIVVRKRTRGQWTITRLIDEKTLNSMIATYLWLILENKGWVVIAGHIGSGKTTMLQALLSLIPPYRKVITIEDVPEVEHDTGLWESLVEKNEIYAGNSKIDSFTLLKFALRRRPDYIVIGEVRGVEARLLVQASRLGHGVLNTIHADSPESVLKRLIAPPISIPRNLLNNIWTIVVMSIDKHSGSRRVDYVSEVNEESRLIDLYSTTSGINNFEDLINTSIRLKRRYSKNELNQEFLERMMFLEKMVSTGVFSSEGFSKAIVDFYSNRNKYSINPPLSG